MAVEASGSTGDQYRDSARDVSKSDTDQGDNESESDQESLESITKSDLE